MTHTDKYGRIWSVKHVDSYCLENNQEIWCRHTPKTAYIAETIDGVNYLTCYDCGRKFQTIHPVLAETIIRDKDTEIKYWRNVSDRI